MPNELFVQPATTPIRQSRWGALRHRDFQRFWLARAVSTAGDNITQLAVTYLASVGLLRVTAAAAISDLGLMAAQAVPPVFLYREKHLPAYVIGLVLFGGLVVAGFCVIRRRSAPPPTRPRIA